MFINSYLDLCIYVQLYMFIVYIEENMFYVVMLISDAIDMFLDDKMCLHY
jgi:hypothetical protein